MVGTESFPRQASASWQAVEKLPYVIGDFVWTGMDHLGESSIGNAQLSTPGRGGAAPTAPAGAGAFMSMMTAGSTITLPFPWFNCYCGDIDLIGDAKPQAYYRRVLWGSSKLEMAVQRPVPEGRTEAISAWGWSDELRSWTWPGFEGKSVKVRLYSTGDQVRLLLNGKEIATRAVSAASEFSAEFDVAYGPGELKAVALLKGEPIATLAFKTAGKPAKLRLTADRASIRRARTDLSYVKLEVLDQAGELVPDAVVPVRFRITGAAELAAVGTANPKDAQSFRSLRPKTFHGKCLAIIRPKGVAGSAMVTVEADGFAPVTIPIQVT